MRIMRSKKKKNIMIIVLCFTLVLMGVGYAAVSQRLTIGGTAKMQGVWDVRIANIQLSRKTGLAKDNSHKYENLSATFETETLAPNDMLEYTVSVSNRGNIDAIVTDMNATLDGPEAIKYTVEGIKKGDVIKEGVTKEVIITIKFDENATVIPSNKTSTLQISFTCIQNTQDVKAENLTVYKTRMKKAEAYPNTTTNFLDGPITRNKIKKITFYDTLNVDGYTNNFDISEDNSGKVLAWYKSDSNGYYELAIGQDGGVIANSDMSYYFQYLTALEEISLEKLDTFGVTNMRNLFYNATSIKNVNASSFDTGTVTNMSRMFYNCSSLVKIEISSFVTTKVTDMSNMFYNCASLKELDVSNFNTSNVTNMSRMFYNCKSLAKLDVTNFNTSKVTNMALMFCLCSGLTELNVANFNTANVTDMSRMFAGCKVKTLDVTNFNTAKVTNMLKMFSECTELTTLDVSGFITTKVTDMSYMFYNCVSLIKLDVTNFNTSKVTNMSNMFYSCSRLTELNVTNFDTSNVTDMSNMFCWCIGLTTIDLSNFNTAKTTNMADMFHSCRNIKELDISSFDTSNVTNMSAMFAYMYNVNAIYVGNKWTMTNVTNNTDMFVDSNISQVTLKAS